MKFSSIKTVLGLGIVGAAVVLMTVYSSASPTEAESVQVVLPNKSPVAVAAAPSETALVLFPTEAAESESADYVAGTLLKGSDQVVYYVTEAGTRRPIDDLFTFVAFGFHAQDVIAVDDGVLSTMPVGDTLTRLVFDGKGALYWVMDGQRWRLNEWKPVISKTAYHRVPTSRLDNLLQDSLPVQPGLKNGTFLRQDNTIYYHIYRSIIPVTKGGYDKSAVIDVPSGMLSAYPERTALKMLVTKLNVDTQVANVRSGPGLDFEIIDTVDQTSIIIATGRVENSNWLQIRHRGQPVWLAGDLVEHQFLLDLLPTVDTPALAPEKETVPEEVAMPQQTSASNTYVGIGARLGSRNGLPAIEVPFAGAPADRAGLQPGDIILAVDGENVTHFSLGEIVNRLRGEIGVAVTLTISRPAGNQRLDISIVRDEINLLKTREICAAHPIRGFGKVWDDHPEVRPWLGCPFTNFRRDEHATRAAVQTFEHGWMLWLETDTVANVDPIYAFFEDDRSYIRYGDRALVDAHGYAPTPPGFYKVGDRFAKVYREEIGANGRLRLGHATNEARDSQGAFQEFENGRMFWAGESDTIYVIYQGHLDLDGDGVTTWTHGWMSYEDTFEAPAED